MRSRTHVNRTLICVALAAFSSLQGQSASSRPAACRHIQLAGQVQAGQPWSSPFGQGWVFRLLPVQPGKQGFTGWDLVVDREEGAGYPDSLLVATPPWYSISEREVATTFGLRAQDAIGWNPRSFHFLTDPAALQQAQKLYRNLGAPKIWTEKPGTPQQATTDALQKIIRSASSGQFHILNARLTPGIADPAPFAQRWALQSSRTPHTNIPSPQPSALGALQSIRFTITLSLPANWKTPASIPSTPGPCSQ